MNNVSGNTAMKGSAPRVITIGATKQPDDVKLRVAAYARVSSASEDQLNSYSAQYRYYLDLITDKESWSLVDIYADEGITGTSAEKRDDLLRMLKDCRRGKIDRILVKSISRFARNTKECLERLRELKQLGIGVYFEKENIDTAKMGGEMMTAMYAAFAQAESESISGNMRWSYQKRMKRGQFVTCKAPFGYRLKDGELKVFEPEAELVKEIFRRFLAGESKKKIGEHLQSIGVRTRDGKTTWHHSAVSYILQNEKYLGNALLQKKYTTESFPREKKRNYGEAEQYLVVGCHEAIITQETFEAAQELIARRAKREAKIPTNQPLAGKLICGCCGNTFRKKLHKETVYWMCRTHHDRKEDCPVKQVPQKAIYEAFYKLHYKLRNHSMEMLSELQSMLTAIKKRKMLWSEDIVQFNKLISELSSQNQTLAILKQQGLVDPDIFISKSNELTKQLRAIKLKKERLLDDEDDDRIAQTKELIEALESGPTFLDAFDAVLFGELVDVIYVDSRERLRFKLKNGLCIEESIERTVH